MSDYLEPPRRYRQDDETPRRGTQREDRQSPRRSNVVQHGGTKINKADIFTLGGMDIPFFAITVALLTIGLVMLFSASYPYALQNEDSSYYFFSRQLVFAIAGFIVMLAVSKLNYKLLKVIVTPLTAVTLLLLAVVLVYHTDNGDFKRWIPIGPLTLQPSDIAKFAVIVLMAYYVSKNAKRMNNLIYGTVVPILILGVFCGLIYLEHHLSCTILVFCIGAVIMFCGGSDWRIFALGVGVMAAVVVVVILNPEVLMNYAGDRIKAWLDKGFDPRGLRWQTNNSLYAIGSGGFFGTGLGNSKQKFLYVSEPQNDFIFAIVCEELGFIGAGIIIALFAAMFIRGIQIALRTDDKFGALLVIGIVSQVAVQTVFNIMVVTDTIPNTGIALPFFSYGGTAILMLLFEMGVVLSVSRKSNQKKV